jgi:M6 family metalloprotease-like protein
MKSENMISTGVLAFVGPIQKLMPMLSIGVHGTNEQQVQAKRCNRRPSDLVLPCLCALALSSVSSVAHAEGFGPAQLWHTYFSPGAEVPLTGDFNNDGRSDIITFVRSAPTGTTGAVWVATSSGAGFGTAQLWNSWFSVGQEVPLVGDFNGDNRDDIVTFIRGTSGAAMGDVYVALSTGTGFGAGQKWHDWFSIKQEVPAVGDVNGDNRDDIITFVRDSSADMEQGDVWVSLSTGTGFAQSIKMHEWFAPRSQVPMVGDVNGDGRADLVAFVRDAQSGSLRGDVQVSLSTGNGFGQVQIWHDFFGIGNEVPRIGDFDGDGRDDIAVFVRDTKAEPDRGDVYVAFSEGNRFGATRLWHARLAWGEEVPVIGDVNGDRRDDVVVFLQDAQPEPRRADVLVSITGDPAVADPTTRQNDFGYGSMKVYGAKALGTRPLLTILMNFSEVRFATNRTPAYFQDRIFTNSVLNINATFLEMSGGRFGWRNAGILGPFDHPNVASTTVNEASFYCSLNLPSDPLAMKWCAGSASDERTVRRTAIELAHQNGFNFATYDTNRDGRVTANELQVLLVSAGGSAANRTTDRECFSPGAGATVTVCPGWVASFGQNVDFSTAAHELAHSLGTQDVYGGNWNSCGLSLQSCTGGSDPMHLDPWNKIQLGWVEPKIYDFVQSGTCVSMNAAYFADRGAGDRHRPVLLYDARRTSGDYFILEHRARGDFDLGVGSPGLAIWQVKNGHRTVEHGVERMVPGNIPSQVVVAGANNVLNTSPAPGSDDLADTAAGVVWPGNDRSLQSVPGGDDVIPPEVHNFTYGAPNGGRGGSMLWTNAHGEITLRYADGTWTELHLRVSSPTDLPGSQHVAWTLNSFRGARPATSYTDSYLRTCYGSVL